MAKTDGGLPLERLSLENLINLDGGVAVKQFLKLLGQCTDDIKARPAEKRPRKIVLTLSLEPKTRIDVDDDKGTSVTVLTGVGLGILLDSKLPNRHTAEYDLGLGVDGSLLFNRDSPFDHRQRSLFKSEPDQNTVDGKSLAVKD